MTMLLRALPTGTTVMLTENGVKKPYYFLGLDDNGNARLLRRDLLRVRQIWPSANGLYSGSPLDLWLENETDGFLSRFTEDLIAALTTSEILLANYSESPDHSRQLLQIARRCFLPSRSEMLTEGGDEGASIVPLLRSVTGQTDNSSARVAYPDGSTSSGTYWTRSASGETSFNAVNSYGILSEGRSPTESLFLRPMLAVKPDTPVSDEGNDVYLLAPAEANPYWTIETKMLLGESAARPTQARVTIPTQHLEEMTVKICSNYGDAVPTWETAVNGAAVALTNRQKSTENWRLALWITARSRRAGGYVGAPEVLIAADGGT